MDGFCYWQDFRSETGLFNTMKERFPNTRLRGSDLFDSVLFKDEQATRIFFSFMAELHKLTSNATPTRTHEFIRRLHESGKLVRCLTQNIDGLESRAGLSCDLFSKECPIVQLHGTLEKVSCSQCNSERLFDEEVSRVFLNGETMPCAACERKRFLRITEGKRGIQVGFMRPSVVLYNENHPHGKKSNDLL